MMKGDSMITIKTFDTKADWQDKRSKKIGGSDSAAVLGMNPWMTNVELWKIKTGRSKQEDISDKEIVKYGINAEQHLRELFKLDFPEYEVNYIEGNIWFNDKYPFAHASLDGWLLDKDGRKGVLEIKTTNILGRASKEKWDKRIPDNYYIQILHYLMVTESDFAILKAQLKYDYDNDVFLQTKHYKIERAEVQEDIEFLENSEKRFYRHIIDDEEPSLILPMI